MKNININKIILARINERNKKYEGLSKAELYSLENLINYPKEDLNYKIFISTFEGELSFEN